jgi:SAM-dependent methyltransferase
MTAHAGDRQRQHYERIHDAYEAHYYDAWSMRYRRRFMYDFLLSGLELDGLLVADLACGSGHNSLELKRRFPGVRTHGFDVSPSACAAYRANTGGEAFETDLTRPQVFAHRYDAALIVGGLHHCIGDLPQTLRNLAAAVKPGGRLLMVEPNSRFLLEPLRRLWYRFDRYFDAATEQALDHEALAASADADFAVEAVRRAGGPAYFLIFNSLILRVPGRAKNYLAPPLFAVEHGWNALPGRLPFAYFLARWRRR